MAYRYRKEPDNKEVAVRQLWNDITNIYNELDKVTTEARAAKENYNALLRRLFGSDGVTNDETISSGTVDLSGYIKGTITPGTIPKAATTDSITDSIMIESGTNIDVIATDSNTITVTYPLTITHRTT